MQWQPGTRGRNQLVIFHLDQGKKVPGDCRHCRKRTSADPNGPGTAPWPALSWTRIGHRPL